MSKDKSTESPVNAPEFLMRVLQELRANTGAIWMSGDAQLVPVLTVGLEDCGLFDGVEGKQFLQQILADTLSQGRAQTFDTEGLIEAGPAGHATLFVSPLLIPGSRPGVILIAERPNLPQQQRLGIIRHIELRCRELSREIAMSAEPESGGHDDISQFTSDDSTGLADISTDTLVTASAPEIRIMPSANELQSAAEAKSVLEYLLSLQRSLDLTEVTNVIVNDGRVLFNVDRVCLAVRRGRKTVIKAVSGQDSVHPRGNLIGALRRLTHQVITAGEAFRFDGALASVPKQLEEPLAEFIQEGGARFLLIVPLVEPERLIKPEESPSVGRQRPQIRKPIGALIIEQMSSSQPSKELISKLDQVTDHIAAATFNATNHSTIFLLPLWRVTGRFFEWLRGRRLAMAIAILILIAATTAAMIVVPWDYRVEAKGRLMPVTQREVFAPWDGQVVELLVEGDDRVVEGQELIRLRNDELEAEFVKLRNQLDEKRKLVDSLKAQFDEAERTNKSEEKLRAQSKRLETLVEIEGIQSQYEILKDRRERLIVRAPIAGIVTTFQIRQLLLNRPVKRGDVLVQVMDDKGDWQLELEIAEHRVGRILKAQKALSPDLQVEYRLLTSPEASFNAALKFLATRTVTSETEGSVLEARAKLDESKLPLCTIGADVRARIGCGKSFLGDVLFGDVIEFVQKYLWW